MNTIFDYKQNEGIGGLFPALDIPAQGAETLIPRDLLRKEPPRIPALSEPDLIRHYTRLSKLNYGAGSGIPCSPL